MLMRFIFKSFKERKSRIAIALFAVIVGSSVAAALLSVTYDIEQKMNRELRAYGANVILTPSIEMVGDRYFNEKDLNVLKTIKHADNIIGAAPYLYGIVRVNSQKVVVAGTRFDQAKVTSPFWEIEGEWIGESDEIDGSILGATLAKKLGFNLGDSLKVEYDLNDMTSRELKVDGILKTGSGEDNQILVNLNTAQEILDKPGKVSLVLVSVVGGEEIVNSIIDDIAKSNSAIQAQPIRKIAKSEANILDKTKLMMFLVAMFTLIVSALCMMTTMTALVLERQREIGILKAIGAGSKEIISLFLTEMGIIGLLGGILGYGVGLFFSQLIGESVFSSSISVRPVVIPIVIAIACGISLLAGILPIKRAVAIEPVIVLRGE